MIEKDKYVQIIKNFNKSILRITSEIFNYRSWPPDFSVDMILEAYNKLHDDMKGVDYGKYGASDLIEHFGFGRWDEDIILIPLYLLKTIPSGTEVRSIQGDVRIVGKDTLDNDNRFGLSAYGFSRSQLRDDILKEVLS